MAKLTRGNQARPRTGSGVNTPSDRQQLDSPSLSLPLWSVVVAAGLVIVGVGLRSIADIIAPIFLVITLVITVHPLRRYLNRHSWPSWLSGLVVLISIYAILIALLGAFAYALGRLTAWLLDTDNTRAIQNLYNQALDQLDRLGLGQNTIIEQLQNVSISSLVGPVTSVFSGVTGGLSLLLLIVTVLVFIAFDAGSFSSRVAIVEQSRPQIAAALGSFALRIRRYWIVTTIFGLIVAIIDGVALSIIGVPLALTWGVLAFVTNYIPNIGFVLGLIPPALVAVIDPDGGLVPMLIVIITYCVINFVIQTLIQPRFTGDAAGITPTIAFVSLIFWTYILGALGALLAVPATLFVKSVMIDYSPRLRWFGVLIDSDSPAGDKAARKARKR